MGYSRKNPKKRLRIYFSEPLLKIFRFITLPFLEILEKTTFHPWKFCKVFFFFNCYLAVPQPTLGHSWGDSLTNLMLITAFFLLIWPKGHREPLSEAHNTPHLEEILRRSETKTHQNSTWFLLNTPRNPTSFFNWPLEQWNFYMYFLQNTLGNSARNSMSSTPLFNFFWNSQIFFSTTPNFENGKSQNAIFKVSSVFSCTCCIHTFSLNTL